MVRRYDSFVLHGWQRDGEQRMDVEHLQSGGRLRNATLTAAVGWIGERGRARAVVSEASGTREATASRIRAGTAAYREEDPRCRS